ncbi:PIN domain-containing protein [Bacillus mycoides]|uniref:PIN domain-containing protein n=1 Tax=Bacillus mycoides TaxID=1405 RepID=UPI003D64CB4C
MDSVSNSEIFDLHFDMLPPFTEKKKTEFKDAFVLTALNNWANSNNKTLYIISSDSDMENYCETKSKLYYMKSIDDFLDMLSRDDEFLYYFVTNIYDDYNSEIEKSIKDKLPTFNVEANQMDIDLSDIEFEVNETAEDLHILEISETSAQIAFNAYISIKATIELFDADNSTYDPEDKIYFYEAYTYHDYDEVFIVPVTAKINFDVQNDDFVKITDVVINENETYYIPIEEECIF